MDRKLGSGCPDPWLEKPQHLTQCVYCSVEQTLRVSADSWAETAAYFSRPNKETGLSNLARTSVGEQSSGSKHPGEESYRTLSAQCPHSVHTLSTHCPHTVNHAIWVPVKASLSSKPHPRGVAMAFLPGFETLGSLTDLALVNTHIHLGLQSGLSPPPTVWGE